MYALPKLVRRPAPPAPPTGRDAAPKTPAEPRPAADPPSLAKLVPEVVDPALLRARDNLGGE